MPYEYDLFLSHNRADKEWTRRLANRIEEDRSGPPLKVFFDEWDMAPGADVPLELERALDASRFIGLVLSPEAVASRWVALERSTAIARDPDAQSHVLLPLLRRDCELPGVLRRLSYIDFRDDRDFEDSSDRLIDVLRGRKARRGSSLSMAELDFREDCALIRQHRVIFDRPAFYVSCIHELFLDDLLQAVEDTSAALNTGALYSRSNRLLADLPPRGAYRTEQFRKSLGQVGGILVKLRAAVVEFGRFIERNIPGYDYWENFYAMVLSLAFADQVLVGAEFLDRIDNLRNEILQAVNELLGLAGDNPLPYVKLSSEVIRDGEMHVCEGIALLLQQHRSGFSPDAALSWPKSEEEMKAMVGQGSRVLRGLGASPGKYTGPARVIHKEHDFASVQTGDVLVCPITTYAEWKTLVGTIGALVTDRFELYGEMYPRRVFPDYRSEGELGFPEVLGTRIATAVITEGQMVEVDGLNGVVRL